MNRKYSLKKNEDIGRLVHLKKSVGNKYYAIYYREKEQEIPKIAISVSKKYGNAVFRNYEKRVTRELLRPKLSKFNNLEALVVIKKDVANLKFEEKKEQIYYLIRKIMKITGVRNEKH